MSMTRRDFESIAHTFRILSADPANDHDTLRRVAVMLCEDFAQANAHFTRIKFLDACGFETSTPMNERERGAR